MPPTAVIDKNHQLYLYIKLYPLEAGKHISKFVVKWSGNYLSYADISHKAIDFNGSTSK